MGIFYRDSLENQSITWEHVIDDINSKDYYNPYCFTSNYYEIFINIIFSLLLEEEVILLDSDFSNEEKVKLTGYQDYSYFNKKIDYSKIRKIDNKNKLLDVIKRENKNWKITLYTSGTTGLPKKVSHSFESITRFVKITSNKKNDTWGYAYNPSHIAGVQVFFQALLNGNSIIRLFGLPKEKIYREIETNNITNISATPTFYRLLIPFEGKYLSVRRLTSGGEKFDEKTISQFKTLFPNAKITNVYASTEAGTLFASEGNMFVIKPEISKYIRIENDELLIHNSLMGDSEFSKDEWYKTGDLIEVVSENPTKFFFVSRKNEMINVGGYKVNPNEVEEEIRRIDGVKDVRVFSKSNSVLGSIICCEVVSVNEQITESTIRNHLQQVLQEFKIPRLIKFVEEISTTRTGKLKRN